MGADYYSILGLTRSATDADIKRRYLESTQQLIAVLTRKQNIFNSSIVQVDEVKIRCIDIFRFMHQYFIFNFILRMMCQINKIVSFLNIIQSNLSKKPTCS